MENNPADRDYKFAILETRNLIDIIMAMGCTRVIHGTEHVQIHVFSPFLGVPELSNNAVLWNLWIYMNQLPGSRVGPILKKLVNTAPSDPRICKRPGQ